MKSLVKLVSILALLFTVCNCSIYNSNKASCDDPGRDFIDCSEQVKDLCSLEKVAAPCAARSKCNTFVGNHFAFPRINNDTQALIQAHIEVSMEFLLMGSVYSEWTENRKGFQNYFEKLSDSAWEDSIALLQHMTVRGGSLETPLSIKTTSSENIKDELAAFSRGLDIQKELLRSSMVLMNTSPIGFKVGEHSNHTKVNANAEYSYRKQDYSDAEFSHFLAGEVSGKLIHRVKDLANHVNLLSEALNQEDVKRGVVIHLYDTQILQ